MDYTVEVSSTSRAEDEHVSSVRCSCGWELTLEVSSPEIGDRAAAKARANHLAQAHAPARGTSSSAPTRIVAARPQAMSGTAGHRLTLDPSVKDGSTWTRKATCECDWTETFVDRSPDRAARLAGTAHREHVDIESERMTARDVLLLLALVLVMGVGMLVLTNVAVQARFA